ncbi:unnamed protein product, partial [Ectocarpus sp. 6 AP-2014]
EGRRRHQPRRGGTHGRSHHAARGGQPRCSRSGSGAQPHPQNSSLVSSPMFRLACEQESSPPPFALSRLAGAVRGAIRPNHGRQMGWMQTFGIVQKG